MNGLNDRAFDAPLPPTVVSAEELEANRQVVRRWYEQVWGQNDALASEAIAMRDYVAHINLDEIYLGNILDTFANCILACPI